jgi:hypothetical protein
MAISADASGNEGNAVNERLAAGGEPDCGAARSRRSGVRARSRSLGALFWPMVEPLRQGRVSVLIWFHDGINRFDVQSTAELL